MGVDDTIPAFLLTTNAGNTLECGAKSDNLINELLDENTLVTHPALTYIATTGWKEDQATLGMLSMTAHYVDLYPDYIGKYSAEQTLYDFDL